MKFYFLCFLYFISISVDFTTGGSCGCKTMRKCYSDMVNTLRSDDESMCIEDAAIGTASLVVYLKALTIYCSEIVTVKHNLTTSEGKHLNEVIINLPDESTKLEEKPTIIIDAGQEGGDKPVKLALLLIQSLVACEDNHEMVKKVQWVILPCTNPDGMEFGTFRPNWKKNTRVLKDGITFGVDISRNFKNHWSLCGGDTNNMFSQSYRGEVAASENETIFVTDVIDKYAGQARIYLAIKRDGHSIGYPYAYSGITVSLFDLHSRVASEIANKVNQKALSVNSFMNNSIHDIEGKPHCGHSVDYAINSNIPLAFEMRVFPDSRNQITSLFQQAPPGYTNSLYSAYLVGIQELYNVVTNQKKYGPIK